MIPAGVQIFVAVEPVDMRYGFERLSGLVRERFGYDPRGGALFVFLGKRRETVKILFCDGSGICLFYKRLDRGTFARLEPPRADAKHLEVDDATLDALLDGLEVAPTGSAPEVPRRRMH